MFATWRRLRVALGIGAIVATCESAAAQQAYTPSITDYGGVGLLQTRSARFGDEGLFSIGVSAVDPYIRYFFSVHGIPGIEAAFRFTSVDNRSIGGGRRRGTTAYQDKGADLKLRLLDETSWRPEVAIGLQDLIGTAQNGAEYIVASKRFYDIDVSIGLGWGRLATGGGLPNPLGLLFKSFKTRGDRSRDDRGGTFTIDSFFAGRNVGVFGGIEWLTPIEGVRLKVEYDSNDFTDEALDNNQKVDSPVNIGVAYQPFPWLDLGVGFERGNTLMVRAAMTPNLNTARPVLKIDTPPVPVTPRPAAPAVAGIPPAKPALREWAAKDSSDRLFDGLASLGLAVEQVEFTEREAIVTVVREDGSGDVDWDAAARVVWDAVPSPLTSVTLAERALDGGIASITLERDATELALALGIASSTLSDAIAPQPLGPADQADIGARITAAVEAEGMTVDAVRVESRAASVWLSQDKYFRTAQAVGRVARIVAAVAPPEIEEITVVNMAEGLETSRVTLLRSDLEDVAAYRGSSDEIFSHAVITAGDGRIPEEAWRPEGRYPAFDWYLSPEYRQHIGGPDGLYLFEIWGSVGAEIELARGLKIRGSSGLSLYSQFDELTGGNSGKLPRVRSLIDFYIKDAFRPIVDLNVIYATQFDRDWYGGLYGGFLEEMYAGVGGEMLFRPFTSRIAVGLDLNHVWQRDFDHDIGFLGYETTTGHLSVYYDSPFWDLQGTVRVGRYLAKDVGVTFELARTFDSGIALGAFSTFTNVSARDFGEGSFDKGFYVSIPLDLFFLRPTKQSVSFVFRPLTRDGGQMVMRPLSLYAVSGGERLGAIADGWPAVLQ